MSTAENVLDKNVEKEDSKYFDQPHKEEDNNENDNMEINLKELTGRGRPKNGVKRYSLNLPCDIYDKVKEVADEHDTSVMELMKRFIKLGLVAAAVEDDKNSQIIIRQNNKDKELMLML